VRYDRPSPADARPWDQGRFEDDIRFGYNPFPDTSFELAEDDPLAMSPYTPIVLAD